MSRTEVPADAKRITTVHVYPPIPIRSMDWMAYDADWDGDPETAHCYAISHGATEAEAIEECRAEMEAREPLADPASAINDIRVDLREIMEG